MAGILDFLQNPNTADRLMGISQALGGLQGRQVDVSPFADRINARGALQETMGNEQLLAKFTPEQRAALAQLGQTNPQAAQDVILQANLAVDQEAKNAEKMAQLRQNPLWQSLSMQQQAALEAVGPEQAGVVLSELAFAQPSPQARILTPDEVASYGLPQGSYQQKPDGTIAQIGGGGQTINVSTGPDESKYQEEVAKGLAQSDMEIAQAGQMAQRAMVQIDALDKALQAAGGGGAGTALIAAAGNMGINLGESTDAAQAAQAIVSQLVPQQRPPGSGPMSDADLELFKQSLPRLINTPGGNQLIIATMRKIAEYDSQRGMIANDLMNGRITRQEADQAYASLVNPLDGVNQAAKPQAVAPEPANPPVGGQGQVLVFDPATGGFK